jgi:hypothetical protein
MIMRTTPPNPTSRRTTFSLAALAGFLLSFLFLSPKQNYVFAWVTPVDRFFKWIFVAHSNPYVLVVLPLVSILVTAIVFRLIDDAKSGCGGP